MMRILTRTLLIVILIILMGCQMGIGEENSDANSKPGSEETENTGDIIWYAGFEDGNIEEWSHVGGFINQSPSDYYFLVSPHAHSGNYSVALQIDTSGPTSTGSHAAYLFYWEDLPEGEYYYSAWYYIPSEVHPGEWWNIWQWKSTYNGNSDDSVPVYSLGITEFMGKYWLYMAYRPDLDSKILYSQYGVDVPKDQWFQIESMYRISNTDTGAVIIWANGEEIFNVTGFPTVLDDNTLYWSVNNYAEMIQPEPCAIYIDDVVISKQRLGLSFDYSTLR